MARILHLPCRQYKNGKWRKIEDYVSLEQKVHIHWPGQNVKTLWAYPDDLTSLVIGHCAIELCAPHEQPKLIKEEGREFYLQPVVVEAGNDAWHFPKLPKGLFLENMPRFMALKGKWEKTGCFHRAAVFDPQQNKFVHYVEDIGRHNCLDRLKGWAVTSKNSLSNLILFVSARGTASLVLKAIKAGFQVMVSRSALTTASIELALKSGLTLIGFARENRFSVYADSEKRILID
ncbi:formate dehydrogenase accessory sulfurtransferase FdhD [Desulfovulcanus sp.]